MYKFENLKLALTSRAELLHRRMTHEYVTTNPEYIFHH
jgi:hypothetical protein